MLSSLRNRSVAFVAAFASFLTARAFAGESHYNHYAVGERAGGMGGAFTALADEATGAYYNPAGILDAPRRGQAAMGVTVSAYQLAALRYESRVSLGDRAQDFSTSSFTTFASAFGYVHTFGKARAHAVGLTITVPENESYSGSVSLGGAKVAASPRTSGVEITNADFTQSFRPSAQTILFGLTYAARPHARVSVGASLLYALRRENSVSSFFLTGDTPGGRVALTESSRFESLHGALAGEVGMKIRATDHLRFGLALRTPTARIHQRATTYQAPSEGTPILAGPSELDVYSPEPLRLSFGVAWEVPKRYTLALDVRWFGSVDPYSPLLFNLANGATGRAADLSRRHVVNVALGGEWRVTEAIALRGGFFTDFTARPTEDPKLNGPDHVNLFGLTFAFAWLTAETTLSLGVNWAFGAGDVPGVRNRGTDAEEVFNASATRHFVTFFLGGSYSL